MSANVTAWASAAALLQDVGADALLLQEHHIAERAVCDQIEAARSWARWRLSVHAAVRTEAGGSSAGVGVAVARHTGLSVGPEAGSSACVASRVQVRHWSGVCPGGVHLLSVYLYAGEGLSQRNLDLLQEVAFLIGRLRGPWICGGDFNLTPAELEHARWPELVGGCVAAPSAPSCGARVLDFFVVERRLRPFVVATQVLTGAGISPHSPVRLLLGGACRRDFVRMLRAPVHVGACLPPACVSEACASAEAVSCEDLDEQLRATYFLAERAASEIMAMPPERLAGRAEGCSYRWQPYCAPRADACGKVSPLAVAWRTGASAMRRLQCRYGDAAWWLGAANAVALLHRTAARIMGDERRGEWLDWFVVVRASLQAGCDRARVGQLGALAASRAVALARADAAASAAAFRGWLRDGPAAGLGRQHRLTRTSTGWMPSSLLAAASDPEGAGEADDRDFDSDPTDGEALLEALPPGAAAPEAHGGSAGALRPASLQEEAEQEALRWGAEWLCGAAYELPWPLDVGAALPPVDAHRLTAALQSFPAGSGLGWDKMHPRAWLRFGEAALDSLLCLFALVEREGRWPRNIGHVVIVLLAKAAGGFRPIGLFPSVVRLWMRVRLADAAVWQSAFERPWLYASAGKGAEVAAWRQAARAEMAAARGEEYAAVLLDLVKAFERVPHAALVQRAVSLGYNIRLLRVSLASYRLPRVLRLDGVCSQLVVAARGITAGSGHAVIELRLLLSDLWDRVHSLCPSVALTVDVDGAGLEATGGDGCILRTLPVAAQVVAQGLTDLRMELSSTKCVALASGRSLASRCAAACRPFLPLTAVRHACSLGVGLAGGRRPAARGLWKRLPGFRKRLPRFAAARRLAVHTAGLLRTGGAAGMTYGAASVGVAPTLLQAQRVAAAQALGDRTRGGDLDLTLAVADGARGGQADPAFAAHLQPIVVWARAVWERLLPRADLLRAAAWAVRRLARAARPWAVVCGPATATAASIARFGWRFHDGLTLVTQRGVLIDLALDPPARVAALVVEAVWQWRWARVSGRVSALRPPAGSPELGPCWRPLARLLDPAIRVHGWTAELRGALRSAVTNRQWPQQRKARAGLVDDESCKLCQGSAGTLLHRSAQCPVLAELRRAHAPPDVLESRAGPHWLARALQPTVAYTVPPPHPSASFEWVVRPPGDVVVDACTVYTDGSCLDGPSPLLRRCGWA